MSFITFEGGEGAGKTTLIDSILERLLSLKKAVIKTRQPGGTPLGASLRALLLNSKSVSPRAELLMFLADRAEHVGEFIKPALSQNTIVLCDRFTDSTLAYQHHFDDNLLNELCSFASYDLIPDLTIYLDIDPKIGLERAKNLGTDRMELKNIEFHSKVRENFLKLAKKSPERIFVIDATMSPVQVFEKAIERIEDVIR